MVQLRFFSLTGWRGGFREEGPSLAFPLVRLFLPLPFTFCLLDSPMEPCYSAALATYLAHFGFWIGDFGLPWFAFRVLPGQSVPSMPPIRFSVLCSLFFVLCPQFSVLNS